MRSRVGRNACVGCCERAFPLRSVARWRGAVSAAYCWGRGEMCASWGKNGRATVGFG